MAAYYEFSSRRVFVTFDLSIQAIAPQNPAGWQVYAGAGLKAVSTVQTAASDTLFVQTAGAPIATRVVYLGTGVLVIGVDGAPVAPFDLTLPYP